MSIFKLTKEEQETFKRAFEYYDIGMFKVSLLDILQKRKHGIRDFAKEIGMAREALYQFLNNKSECRWSTMHAMIKALGFRLVITSKTKETKD